jgi:hypothetical protein
MFLKSSVPIFRAPDIRLYFILNTFASLRLHQEVRIIQSVFTSSTTKF